jgi:hypothetical protein
LEGKYSKHPAIVLSQYLRRIPRAFRLESAGAGTQVGPSNRRRRASP